MLVAFPIVGDVDLPTVTDGDDVDGRVWLLGMVLHWRLDGCRPGLKGEGEPGKHPGAQVDASLVGVARVFACGYGPALGLWIVFFPPDGGVHAGFVAVESNEDGDGVLEGNGGDGVGFGGAVALRDGADEVSGHVVEEDGVELGFDDDKGFHGFAQEHGGGAGAGNEVVAGFAFGAADPNAVKRTALVVGDDKADGEPEFLGFAVFLKDGFEAPGFAGTVEVFSFFAGVPAEAVGFDGFNVEATGSAPGELIGVGDELLVSPFNEFFGMLDPEFGRGGGDPGLEGFGIAGPAEARGLVFFDFGEFFADFFAGVTEVDAFDFHEVFDGIATDAAGAAPESAMLALSRPDMETVGAAAGGAGAVVFAAVGGGGLAVVAAVSICAFKEVHNSIPG